jgi:hypothetical protein
MANVRSLSREAVTHDLADASHRARLQRLAAVFDEVTYRVATTRARIDVALPDEAARLRRELAVLEDDWRCLASAQAFSAGFARAG